MFRVFVIAALVARPFMAAAQATPLVDPTARVYRDLDRLASMGLIDTLMVGVRPFSEREIVRRLTEAQNNLGRLTSTRDWAERTIAADLARYRRERNRVIDAASVEAAAMDSPFRNSANFGTFILPASINPLAANRQGRPLADDAATEAVETTHSAVIGRHLAVVLNPRMVMITPRSGSSSSGLALQSGYVRTMVGDLSIEIGRDYSIFGQAPTGGQLLSINAPALDMIRIENDGAWRIPKFSSVFGPVRASLFLADLGAKNQPHPHAKLVAYHLSMLPLPNFEFGLQAMIAGGGDGAEPATFADRLYDATILPLIFEHDAAYQFSNRFVGLDAHWRMPQWRGMDLYVESNADDFNGRAGALAGLALTCLSECGKTSLRAEYRRTGTLYYTHWDSPIAARGSILGDPLGPRAFGGYLTAETELRRTVAFSVTGAFESRKGEGDPRERRARIETRWTFGEDRAIATSISGGLEKAWNFGFESGRERMSALLRVGVIARSIR